jgi:hypothetical protein
MKNQKDKPTIVVEVRGGTVVGVYGSEAEVVLVDWDELDAERNAAARIELTPFSEMPGDTQSVVNRYAAASLPAP